MGMLAALLDGDPRQIEFALGRKAPFGNQLQAKVRALMPRLELTDKFISPSQGTTLFEA